LGTIKLKNIKVFAFHGCLKEETKIGSDYRVDLVVKANLQQSSISDKLIDTVDYVLLNAIVKEEMNIPSKLLETVAKRILNRVLAESNLVTKVTVSISKINPPIDGDVEMVTIKLTEQIKKEA
jgi:7,8-dihydroneopterin aldolase/epimerase/oxygenase